MSVCVCGGVCEVEVEVVVVSQGLISCIVCVVGSGVVESDVVDDDTRREERPNHRTLQTFIYSKIGLPDINTIISGRGRE